ncbi:hypothetical protein RRF57_006522 [Xylaria bambusicola]|uniref:Heterokaryon incompatibility domain-containing protein n=1 Tax=Xylaria bambusicola TaxID=326684 RepID=A0AAN7ULC0_9PEZI
MWLINTTSLELKEFLGEPNDPRFPRYAILSHTWGDGEVTFRDMQNVKVAEKKAGFSKIAKCCEIARGEGLNWAWVDTCCIDKTSSAELSEAINSMFRWYEFSTTCYAYLSDVGVSDSDSQRPAEQLDWKMSRWFTRGWTLQELIAPYEVIIYDRQWKQLGTKRGLAPDLKGRTRIPENVLLDSPCRRNYSVASRMSWATGRETTRIEDRAYSLFGLFDINMPLLYGEGNKALLRLHQEILSTIEDDTIFLGGLAPRNSSVLSCNYLDMRTESQMLVTPGNLFDESLVKMTPLPSTADRLVTQQSLASSRLWPRKDPRKDPRLRGEVISMPMRIIQIAFANGPTPRITITRNQIFQVEAESIDRKMIENRLFDDLRSDDRSLCLGMLRCGTDGQLVARYFMCHVANDELLAEPLPVYRFVSPQMVYSWPYMQCYISLNRGVQSTRPHLKGLRDPANWGSREVQSGIHFGNGWNLNSAIGPVTDNEDAEDDRDHKKAFGYHLYFAPRREWWFLSLGHYKRERYTVEIKLSRLVSGTKRKSYLVVDEHNDREGHVTELCHRLPVIGGSAELVVSVYYEIDTRRHWHSPMIRFRAFEPSNDGNDTAECEASG